MASPSSRGSVALVTLGCTRNEVDSEELAGRLAAEGWTLVDDAADADVAVVNTCGFVEQAKKDSIDTLLEAADLKETGRTQAVVAVGCLAERYGQTLADELPEADAVLGFDSYRDMSSHLTAILGGSAPASHVPRDRRTLLPLSPVDRSAAAAGVGRCPGTRGRRRRPSCGSRLDAPPLGAAEDRQRLRPALLVLRHPDVPRVLRLAPAAPTSSPRRAGWASRVCASCSSSARTPRPTARTSATSRLLEKLLPELAAVEGVERVRVSYLQPAEVRPGLLEAMAETPGVDAVLRPVLPARLARPCCAGCAGSAAPSRFLELLEKVRAREPLAGVRSNVIVGFPGETEDDVAELERLPHRRPARRRRRLRLLRRGRHRGRAPRRQAARRRRRRAGRAAHRPGRGAHRAARPGAGRGAGRRAGRGARRRRPTVAVGRAEHQGPDVDGVCLVRAGAGGCCRSWASFVEGVVVDAVGVDLVVETR